MVGARRAAGFTRLAEHGTIETELSRMHGRPRVAVFMLRDGARRFRSNSPASISVHGAIRSEPDAGKNSRKISHHPKSSGCCVRSGRTMPAYFSVSA
jgi:hypothetical protein